MLEIFFYFKPLDFFETEILIFLIIRNQTAPQNLTNPQRTWDYILFRQVMRFIQLITRMYNDLFVHNQEFDTIYDSDQQQSNEDPNTFGILTGIPPNELGQRQFEEMEFVFDSQSPSSMIDWISHEKLQHSFHQIQICSSQIPNLWIEAKSSIEKEEDLLIELEWFPDNKKHEVSRSANEIKPNPVSQPLQKLSSQPDLKNRNTKHQGRKHFFPHFMILLRSYIRETYPNSRQLIKDLGLSQSNTYSKKKFVNLLRNEQFASLCDQIFSSDVLINHLVTKQKHRFFESTKVLLRKHYPSVRQYVMHRNQPNSKFRWLQSDH